MEDAQIIALFWERNEQALKKDRQGAWTCAEGDFLHPRDITQEEAQSIQAKYPARSAEQLLPVAGHQRRRCGDRGPPVLPSQRNGSGASGICSLQQIHRQLAGRLVRRCPPDRRRSQRHYRKIPPCRSGYAPHFGIDWIIKKNLFPK